MNTEEDVCNALQHWVMHDPLKRKSLFGDLFGESILFLEREWESVTQGSCVLYVLSDPSVLASSCKLSIFEDKQHLHISATVPDLHSI